MTTSASAQLVPILLSCLSVACAASAEVDGATGEAQSVPSSWRENGCEESDLDDRRADDAERTIHFGKDGLIYSPRCVLVSVNQAVAFDGNFAAHPLAPGNPRDENSGTESSPIPGVSSGTETEVPFPKAGIYPYYCTIHAFNEGEGMAGVVVVR